MTRKPKLGIFFFRKIESPSPAMTETVDLEMDFELLPVSGIYVSIGDQTAKAALAINPKPAIPMHYGTIVGDAEVALNIEKALEGKVEMMVLEKA